MGFLDFIFGSNESSQGIDLRNLTPEEQDYYAALMGNLQDTLANMNPEQREAKVKELTEEIYARLSGNIDRGIQKRGASEDATMARRGLLSSSEQGAARRTRESEAGRLKGEASITSRMTAEDIGYRDALANLQTAGGLGSLLNSLNQYRVGTSDRWGKHPSEGLLSAAGGAIGYGLGAGPLSGLFGGDKPAQQLYS